MEKSPDAFRTISEVADALETPAHVLRFWESRFPQIKPVKRAGGRRYYRPADVALLGGIRHLLHDDGMTIRGVQKILREQGVRHVAAMAPGTDVSVFDVEDEDLILDLPVSGEVPETGQILSMEPIARRVTTLPETTAEVVQLHAAPEVEPAEDLVDLSDGFLLPTANRRPLPSLEPEMPAQDVAEAAHVWVDDPEPEFDWSAQPLFPQEGASRALPDLSEAEFAADTDEAGIDLLPEAVPAEFALEPEDEVEAGDFVATADFLERSDLSVEVDLDEPEGPVSSDPLTVNPVATEEAPELAAAKADAMPPNLAGIAARLRALPQPVLPESGLGLAELQMRLGLLHAQMAEAVRARK